jgi:hypothetical protein
MGARSAGWVRVRWRSASSAAGRPDPIRVLISPSQSQLKAWDYRPPLNPLLAHLKGLFVRLIHDEDEIMCACRRAAPMQFRRGILAITRMGGRERAPVRERWTCHGKSHLCHALTSSHSRARRQLNAPSSQREAKPVPSCPNEGVKQDGSTMEFFDTGGRGRGCVNLKIAFSG